MTGNPENREPRPSSSYQQPKRLPFIPRLIVVVLLIGLLLYIGWMQSHNPVIGYPAAQPQAPAPAVPGK